MADSILSIGQNQTIPLDSSSPIRKTPYTKILENFLKNRTGTGGCVSLFLGGLKNQYLSQF